ncbi:receptor-like protein EIX2 [Vicia villosa]|uniref:receptor-like protein EIX2 n=1 Tax=Vicia villosa TaxID=3911 RepID=UPI00273AFF68|nr:receptor-like protein EIX2 [Vicia villosa]XP_058768232.1 receptor-like protein EIX2 [Vicia villosa]
MLHCGFHFLFCMVTILCICVLCVESFDMNKCVESEKRALLKFKDSFTFGRDNRITSWKGEECCEWEGISCDDLTGHVTSLDLQLLYDDYERSQGKLDSSICELQHLTSLYLQDNHLEGGIPECIGSLGNVIELDLHGNEFVGVIPPSLGNLSNLRFLDLKYNYDLRVNDLAWLSRLSNLRFLDLSDMNLGLVVDWFSPISKIPSLFELHLSGCELQNVSHKSIPHLNSSISLKFLDLSYNSLNSCILSWVVNVSKVLTHLDLSYNSMQQSIPNEFGSMVFLQSLDLSYNSMQQIIPYEFGNMVFLQSLDLSHNELQGSIPKSFKSMCRLKELHLNSNKLSGQLSGNIQQLCCANIDLGILDLSDNPFTSEPLPNLSCFSSLVELYLRHTNLVGLLPNSIYHLSFLQTLDLSHNHLSGPFPHKISQLFSLEVLVLSSNEFNGSINETRLSNLSNLKSLGVAHNSLSFNLSVDWVPPFKLETLVASSCLLGPKFPVWLKQLRELRGLDISNTSISDSFPKWFWNLSSSLEYLNVSHNKLNGPLPKSLQSTKVSYDKDHVWDFSFNNLSDSLPAFPDVSDLFLSNNMFTGSLSSFCTSTSHSLVNLDLSSNFFKGNLFDCWWKFQSLEFLNLARNNLSGKVPNSIGALRQIESLYLNNNNFSGEIPSLILCHNLKLIDVGDNNLHGKIPMWIGHHLPMLIVVRLRANKFHGNIPTNMCNLSFLQVLDLSINNITGEIPQCFGDLRALSNSTISRESFHHFSSSFPFIENDEAISFNDDEILAWKGSNREYATNLRFMKIIDLSCNQLSGEIPKSITKLVALVGLNLTGNNLTGFIPNNIGHMKSLESLDLSKNHLFGRIPISFSNLTFLAYMNLSFNNLEGRIPLGTQLQSFDPSSYMGNTGLCGQPLVNHCPNDVISPTKSHKKHDTSEDEDKLITFGFYVSLGLGFIIGFWGVCGTLVIKTSWRNAYFKFFKNINDWIQITLAVFVIKFKRRFQVED